jgi:4'-phosphopantetheinyl transferase
MTPGRVHVWTIALDRPTEGHWDHLSDDERKRADRFRFERDRRRYIVARASMRRILAEYLDASPAALVFRYGPHGKPELREGTLAFNLAHSHERAVLAVAADGPVGVDLEWRQNLRDADGIVGRFFTAPEAVLYRELPVELRPHAFYRGWTVKEAYLKAIGKGLAGPLEGIVVDLDPRRPARLEALSDDEPSRWTLQEFDLGPDYLGAVMVAGPAVVKYFQVERQDV